MRSALIGFFAVAAALVASPSAFAEDPVGNWVGTLVTPDGKIPVKASITKGADGALAGVGESPQTMPDTKLALEKLISDGATLSFEAPQAGGSFKGAWDAAKKSWVGQWTANGASAEMIFARAP